MPNPKTWGDTIGIRLKLDDDARFRALAAANAKTPAQLAREMILRQMA